MDCDMLPTILSGYTPNRMTLTARKTVRIHTKAGNCAKLTCQKYNARENTRWPIGWQHLSDMSEGLLFLGQRHTNAK